MVINFIFTAKYKFITYPSFTLKEKYFHAWLLSAVQKRYKNYLLLKKGRCERKSPTGSLFSFHNTQPQTQTHTQTHSHTNIHIIRIGNVVDENKEGPLYV